MSLFAFLLAIAPAAPAPEVQCIDSQAALRAVVAVRERPTPLSLMIGSGSDWGAKYLILKTTHHLAVPGIPTMEGEATVTYYSSGRDRTCTQVLTETTCPHLRYELDLYRARSYVVMHNRSKLREGAAHHPPFAELVVEDGDGTIMRLITQSDGPLLHDASQTFRALQSCTSAADQAAGQID